MKTTYILLMVGLLGCVSCKARNPQIESASVKLSVVEESDSAVITGDARTELYYPLLQGKRVAVFGNHTALLPSGEHLVDKLLRDGHSVSAVFSPEHGFRGTADAGEHVRKIELPVLADAGPGELQIQLSVHFASPPVVSMVSVSEMR